MNLNLLQTGLSLKTRLSLYLVLTLTRGERLGKNVMDSTDSPVQRWRYVDATLAESVESTTFLQALYARGH